jgi:hypothetical protein
MTKRGEMFRNLDRLLALLIISVVILCAAGTTPQRTWEYDFRGACQAGATSAAINFSMANAPIYVACSAAQMTSQWSVPAGTIGTSFWVELMLPPGVTSSSEYTTTTIYNTSDASSSDSAMIQIEEACVPIGYSSASPTFYAVGPLQDFHGTGGQVDSEVMGSFTAACNAGSTLFVRYEVMANSMAQPLNFSYVGISVKGAP